MQALWGKPMRSPSTTIRLQVCSPPGPDAAMKVVPFSLTIGSLNAMYPVIALSQLGARKTCSVDSRRTSVLAAARQLLSTRLLNSDAEERRAPMETV